jgi:hypothetical protein
MSHVGVGVGIWIWAGFRTVGFTIYGPPPV